MRMSQGTSAPAGREHSPADTPQSLGGGELAAASPSKPYPSPHSQNPSVPPPFSPAVLRAARQAAASTAAELASRGRKGPIGSAGLTQAELAGRLNALRGTHMGGRGAVGQASIARWETGLRTPDASTWALLWQATQSLGATVVEIVAPTVVQPPPEAPTALTAAERRRKRSRDAYRLAHGIRLDAPLDPRGRRAAGGAGT
jgi:transcriptional regulator with XRE-family HTH domain